tara:strand:- start:876 stop:2315 length:1440 start_codon:yes stop_codon:yes gene_type:complete
VKAKEFIEKNFKRTKKFEPIFLHDVDDEIYLEYFSQELTDKFYKKFPDLEEYRSDIGHLEIVSVKKGKKKNTLVFKFDGSVDSITKEIKKEIEAWFADIDNETDFTNWREQTKDLGGQAYNCWRLLDGKFSLQWQWELFSRRHDHYLQLASYRYLLFFSEMLSNIGTEHLVKDPEENFIPPPIRCRHFFKKHEDLKKFDVSKWSKELQKRKVGGQGIQPSPDLKDYVLENFLQDKEKFYELKKNTFYLIERKQDEYHRMSFKTIFFDYMTLWNAKEKERLAAEKDDEKREFIKKVEIKFVNQENLDQTTLNKLLGYAKENSSISELGVGLNFLMHLIALINNHKKWSQDEKLDKKLALIKFTWRYWFKESHILFKSVEGDEEKFAYELFLNSITDKDSSIKARRDLNDEWGFYNLHNRIELLYKYWNDNKPNSSFDEFLDDYVEDLIADYLVAGKQCFIYDHINASPPKIWEFIEQEIK